MCATTPRVPTTTPQQNSEIRSKLLENLTERMKRSAQSSVDVANGLNLKRMRTHVASNVVGNASGILPTFQMPKPDLDHQANEHNHTNHSGNHQPSNQKVRIEK